jgi:hypothetical protein
MYISDDNIKKYLEELVYEVVQWIRVVQNKVLTRS